MKWLHLLWTLAIVACAGVASCAELPPDFAQSEPLMLIQLERAHWASDADATASETAKTEGLVHGLAVDNRTFQAPVGRSDVWQDYVLINYRFNSDVDGPRRRAFEAAVKQFHSQTCLMFVESTTEESPHIAVGRGNDASCNAFFNTAGGTDGQYGHINLGVCSTADHQGEIIQLIEFMTGVAKVRKYRSSWSSMLRRLPSWFSVARRRRAAEEEYPLALSISAEAAAYLPSYLPHKDARRISDKYSCRLRSTQLGLTLAGQVAKAVGSVFQLASLLRSAR